MTAHTQPSPPVRLRDPDPEDELLSQGPPTPEDELLDQEQGSGPEDELLDRDPSDEELEDPADDPESGGSDLMGDRR